MGKVKDMTGGSIFESGPEPEPVPGTGKYFGADSDDFEIPEWPVVKIFSGTRVVGINSRLLAEKLNQEIGKTVSAEDMVRLDPRTAAEVLDMYSRTHRVEDAIEADLFERTNAGPGRIRIVDDQTTAEIASALIQDPEFRQHIELILGNEDWE